MNVKELYEFLKDLPDDAEITIEYTNYLDRKVSDSIEQLSYNSDSNTVEISTIDENDDGDLSDGSGAF